MHNNMVFLYLPCISWRRVGFLTWRLGGFGRTWRRRHAYGACIKVARGIPSLLVLLAGSILLFFNRTLLCE